MRFTFLMSVGANMSKIELRFAELHSPLFLAGTNLQMKLDPRNRTGLSLVYDRAEKELLVTYNDAMAIVPISNVSSMTPAPGANAAESLAAVAQVRQQEQTATPDQVLAQKAMLELQRRGVAAQVATPQSHVHAGPGHGDNGQKLRGKVNL